MTRIHSTFSHNKNRLLASMFGTPEQSNMQSIFVPIIYRMWDDDDDDYEDPSDDEMLDDMYPDEDSRPSEEDLW